MKGAFMPHQKYSDDQKLEALAILAANNGNITKTSRETHVDRATLRKWQRSKLADSPEITTLKNELQDERRQLMKTVMFAALKRMLEIIPLETDLHKLGGAVKIVQGSEVTHSAAAILEREAGIDAVPATGGPTGTAVGGSVKTN